MADRKARGEIQTTRKASSLGTNRNPFDINNPDNLVADGMTLSRKPYEDASTAPTIRGEDSTDELRGSSRSKYSLTPEDRAAVERTATKLGITPQTLISVIGYETIGTMNPTIKGGKGGNYQGLIQFGPGERKAYGYDPKATFAEQVEGPVYRYLSDRGVKPGHGVAEVYSIVNAGSLKNGQPRWNASDGYGTVKSHVARIEKLFVPQAEALLAGNTWDRKYNPMSAENIPTPKARPSELQLAIAPHDDGSKRGAVGAALGYASQAEKPLTPAEEAAGALAKGAEPTPAASKSAKPTTYVVKKGDNPWSIAERLAGSGPKAVDLLELNNISDPKRLMPGQTLKIPSDWKPAVPVIGQSHGKTVFANDPEIVKLWQTHLTEKGLYSGEIDGKFGPKTRMGTAELQTQLKAKKLDGVVGPETWGLSGIDPFGTTTATPPAAAPAEDWKTQAAKTRTELAALKEKQSRPSDSLLSSPEARPSIRGATEATTLGDLPLPQEDAGVTSPYADATQGTGESEFETFMREHGAAAPTSPSQGDGEPRVRVQEINPDGTPKTPGEMLLPADDGVEDLNPGPPGYLQRPNDGGLPLAFPPSRFSPTAFGPDTGTAALSDATDLAAGLRNDQAAANSARDTIATPTPLANGAFDWTTVLPPGEVAPVDAATYAKTYAPTVSSLGQQSIGDLLATALSDSTGASSATPTTTPIPTSPSASAVEPTSSGTEGDPFALGSSTTVPSTSATTTAPGPGASLSGTSILQAIAEALGLGSATTKPTSIV